MIFGYLRKTIWRNKTRTFFLTVGIIVSIMLVTGVNISSNAMAQSLIQNSLDEVKVDFTVVPSSFEENETKIVDKLNTLEDTLDEFVFAYVGAYGWSYQTVINPSGGNISWDFLNTSSNYYEYMNTSHFCGLKKDIFTEPRVADRFNDVIKSNETLNFTQEGVYINYKTAQKYGIVPGQNISIGALSQAWDDTEEIILNFTAQSTNISVLGIFNLINSENFIQVFNPDRWGGYMGENDIALLGGFSFIEELVENLIDQLEDEATSQGFGMNPPEFTLERNFGVMIDHSSLNVMSVNELRTQIKQIETKIKVTGGTLILYVESRLDRIIENIAFEIALYQGIFLIISVPVIILGWFLTKTNFHLSYEKRRREIALLKVKGGVSKQLKFMFFFEAVIIGATGGALGVLGGNLTST